MNCSVLVLNCELFDVIIWFKLFVYNLRMSLSLLPLFFLLLSGTEVEWKINVNSESEKI